MEGNQDKEKVLVKEMCFLASVYLFSYVLIFINNGIFWDTWVLYNQPLDILVDTFNQAGAPMVGYYHYFILDIVGVWGDRLTMLLSYILAGLFLNKALKKFSFGMQDRLIIVAFFLVLPLNFARISAINYPSALCYALFFFGAYAFFSQLEHHGRKKVVLRICALGAFYISFLVSSLLVFYGVVVIAFFYWCRLKKLNLPEAWRLFVKNGDFWLLPLFFFYIKTSFFKPYGLYEGYNSVERSAVETAFFSTPDYLLLVCQELYDLTDIKGLVGVIAVISTLIFMMFGYVVKGRSINSQTTTGAIAAAIFGMLCLYLAAFPYVVVGKTLNFLDWESRDQILLPLGFSFVLYSLVCMTMITLGQKASHLILSILLSIFVVKNGIVYYDYLIDNLKQQSLIVNFENNKDVRNNTSFLIVDHTQNLNTLHRVYRFYEWTGMMRKAFGDQSRFAVNINRFNNQEGYYDEFTRDSSYNMEGLVVKKPEHFIVIDYGEGFEDKKNKVLWTYFMSQEKYKEMILGLINVKVGELKQ